MIINPDFVKELENFVQNFPQFTVSLNEEFLIQLKGTVGIADISITIPQMFPIHNPMTVVSINNKSSNILFCKNHLTLDKLMAKIHVWLNQYKE